MTVRRNLVGLTYIRGFAALWVVLYHYSRHFGTALSGDFVQRGHLGVDLFFVLSGFIISHVYVNEVRSGAFHYRDFLVKRFARIYPVHAVTMIAAITILTAGVAAGLSTVDLRNEAMAVMPTALMLHAYGLFPRLHLNYPSWSISAEFFAYLLFPILAAGLLRVRLPLVLGVALFGTTVWSTSAMFRADFFELTAFSLPRIVPEFTLGIGLYLHCQHRQIGLMTFWSGLLLSVALLLGPNWLAVIGFAMMIAVLYTGDTHLHRFPAPWVEHLGKISYSIYMVHGLIEMTGFKVIGRVLGISEDGIPLVFLPVIIAVTVVAGHLLHAWIEEPANTKIKGMWQSRTGHSLVSLPSDYLSQPLGDHEVGGGSKVD